MAGSGLSYSLSLSLSSIAFVYGTGSVHSKTQYIFITSEPTMNKLTSPGQRPCEHFFFSS